MSFFSSIVGVLRVCVQRRAPASAAHTVKVLAALRKLRVLSQHYRACHNNGCSSTHMAQAQESDSE
jgi:hypothetical protein